MRREEVGRGRIDGAGLLRLELGIVLHRGEEAHRAVGIVTGARGDADADGVGLEFLRPREARQRELRFGERQRAGCRIADHVGDDAADEVGLARLLLADLGVARDHVAHLMGQHRGELGIVVGERDQSARHVELAGRQREGVDRLRIEHGDLVMQVRPLGRRDQALDRLLDHGLQPRIVVDAAIGREDALMLAQHRGRHRRRRPALPARRSTLCGAPAVTAVQAASSERRDGAARPPAKPVTCRFPTVPVSPRHPSHADQSVRTSVPIQQSRSAPDAPPRSRAPPARRAPRSSIQPRTLTRRPARAFKSRPAAVKLRSFRFRIVTVKSSDHRRPKFT